MLQDDGCIKKIFGYLGVNDLSALCYTCTRTQELVEQYVSKNNILLSFSGNFDEIALEHLGKHMRLVKILLNLESFHALADDFRLNGDTLTRFINTPSLFFMELNKNCVNLTELTIDQQMEELWAAYLIMESYTWPNLRKIKILSYNSPQCFEAVFCWNCPKLTQLQIGNVLLYNNRPEVALDDADDNGSSFCRLNAIMVSENLWLWKDVINFVKNGLNQDIRKQIKCLDFGKITVYTYFKYEYNYNYIWELIEILAQFPNANTPQDLIVVCGEALQEKNKSSEEELKQFLISSGFFKLPHKNQLRAYMSKQIRWIRKSFEFRMNTRKL